MNLEKIMLEMKLKQQVQTTYELNKKRGLDVVLELVRETTDEVNIEWKKPNTEQSIAKINFIACSLNALLDIPNVRKNKKNLLKIADEYERLAKELRNL